MSAQRDSNNLVSLENSEFPIIWIPSYRFLAVYTETITRISLLHMKSCLEQKFQIPNFELHSTLINDNSEILQVNQSFQL